MKIAIERIAFWAMVLAVPIPDFKNGVLPPHKGDAREPEDVSPYMATPKEVCERFGFSPERKIILHGWLDYREQIHNVNMTSGFQWLDGSF